jgi:hypothetical protein
MQDQQRTFECDIDDRTAREHFHAAVTVVIKHPIAASTLDDGQRELAHIYITSLADRWKGSSATFTESPSGGLQKSTSDEQYAVRGGRSKDHSHFVVFNVTGTGKYIRRNRFGTDVEKRMCSTWDLGATFGSKVAEALRELM